jgi:PAS domain-containing protein
MALSAAVALGMAVYMYRRGTLPGARDLSVLWAACGIWSLAYVGEIRAPGLAAKVRWVDVQYIGIVAVPVAWAFFALRYASKGRYPTRRQTAPLLVVPAITLLLQWTNPLHGLMRTQVGLESVGPIQVIDKAYGPWMVVHTAYSYLALLAGSLALARALPGNLAPFRRQRLLVLAGCALPWGSNALYLFAATSIRLDPTPLTMTMSAGLCAWVLLRLGLFDLIPAARSRVIEQMNIGILVADSRGRLVDVNPAASQLLGLGKPAPVGRPLDEALYAHSVPSAPCSGIDAGSEQIVIPGEQGTTYLEVRRAPLHTRGGQLGGQVVTVVDISERHRARQEREALIASLQRALAEVRTLGGLLPICSQCKRIRDDEGYWTRLEEYITTHSGAEFTHGICPDCLRTMYPDLAAEDSTRPPVASEVAADGDFPGAQAE